MSTVKLEITEGQIQNAIAVALAEAFTPEKKDVLLRDLIRAHLTTKKGPYDKETLLSETVNTHIKLIVKDQLEKDLQAMRPEVEVLVSKFFGSTVKPQITENLEKAISAAVSKDLQISIQYRDW